MALNDDLLQFLQKIFDKVKSETQDVLSTIISRQCTIEVSEIKEFQLEEVASNYPEPVLMVEFAPVKDPEGKARIFVQKDLAAKISSWMMMMDEILEFGEETIDSIQETANQVLGTLTTSLAEIAGGNVDFKDIRAVESEVNETVFPEPELVAVKFSLNIENDQDYVLYLVLTMSTPTRFMDEVFAMDMDIDDEGADIDALMTDGAPAEPDLEIPPADDAGDAGEAADAGGGLGDVLGDLGDLGDLGAIGGEIPAGEPAPAPITGTSIADLGVDPDKIELLMDLSLPVSIELGRTKMMIKDILELGHGSVIEFDKLAGEPVDLLINDKKIAEGEVVVIDEHFGIRITNLVKPSERLKKLGE